MVVTKGTFLFFIFFSMAYNLNAQSILTEEDAVTLALKKSPVLHAATLQVRQQKHLQGTSFNLANPDVTLESPTGEFMVVGVTQSFAFPSVYVKQGQVARQQTVLAERSKTITEADVKKQARTAYLNLQFTTQTLKQLQKQDSVYADIVAAAERQFAAGQIDFVAKTLAASEYGEVHNEYMQAKSNTLYALQELQIITGFTDSIIPVTFTKVHNPSLITSAFTDSSAMAGTPLIRYYAQTQFLAKKELQLKRHQALPGFSFGYMNQGEKITPYPMRLSAGINIPIWFWQYSSAIKAAKANLQVTQQQTLAQQQNLNAQLQQEKNDAIKFETSLSYYEKSGLQQADDLITASGRMFAAGHTDYITYLRTLSEAYSIRVKYLETLRAFNQSVINISYLNGQ